MIEFAGKEDIPQIAKMWCNIFDEDKEICNLFYQNIFADAITPVYKENGKIVSSLFLLPCRFGKYKGLCVYCAMTAEEFRGQGIMKKLLDFSDDFRMKKGYDFLFLVPAEKKLFEYYKKCGYIPFGIKNIFKEVVKTSFTGNIAPCSAKEYIAKREKNLINTKKLCFPDSITEYWITACERYGGKAVASNEAAALFFPDGERLFLKDISGSEKGVNEIVNYAQTEYPNYEIIAEGYFKGEKALCGMIKTDNKDILNNDYYIGITLE